MEQQIIEYNIVRYFLSQRQTYFLCADSRTRLHFDQKPSHRHQTLAILEFVDDPLQFWVEMKGFLRSGEVQEATLRFLMKSAPETQR